MNLHKNNNVVKHDLGDRLMICVDRVGGKRALATAALISEAQLFRYINGDTDVPSEKLVAIAKAANVDPSWLLTGDGGIDVTTKNPRPIFRADLMVQIITQLEELLVEFEKPFNPKQRARAATFLYNALRHEESKRITAFTIQKFDMLKYLSYLGQIRTEEELEILDTVVELLEYSSISDFSADDIAVLRTWCNLIVRGIKGYYSSYPGQIYFEQRTGGQLEPKAILSLQNLVVEVLKLTGKTSIDWLDLGCGNGRHLAHLAKHMPNIQIKGIELSQLGFNICKDLMDAEKLPKDSVMMADLRHLPYNSQSFDAVFAHMSLHCLPFIPGTGLGMEEALEEMGRVLRPGGIATLVFPAGDWRDYSMPRQFMNRHDIDALVKDTSFEIIRCTVKDEQDSAWNSSSSKTPQQMKFAFNSSLWVLLQKK